MQSAVGTSIAQAAAGTTTGVAIETILPAHSESLPIWETVLATAVQLALNGVAITYSADYLDDGRQPGFVYSFTLMESQPELSKRVRFLGETIRALAGQRVSQMHAQMA